MTINILAPRFFSLAVASRVVAMTALLAVNCGSGAATAGVDAGEAASAQPVSEVGAPLSEAPVAKAFRSTLVSVPTGSCADVDHSSVANFTRLQAWTCNGSDAQLFDFKPVAGRANTYFLVNVNSGKCVYTYRFGIDQYTCPSAPDTSLAMMWTLRPVDAASGKYQIVRTSDIGSIQERCITSGSVGSQLLDSVCNTTPGTQVWKLTGL